MGGSSVNAPSSGGAANPGDSAGGAGESVPEMFVSGITELDSIAFERAELSVPASPDKGPAVTFQKTVVPGLIDRQRYKITGEFARGGMGRILLAYDRATGREVAIKELIGSPHEADPYPVGGKLQATGPTLMGGPSRVPGGADPDSSQIVPPDELTVERFLREARITSRLEHPNIIPVYEIAQRKNGVWYYSMKFVRGVTLGKRLRDIHRDQGKDAKAKLAERLKLLGPFIDVCNAIAYAHSKGVIHRDLKPENVMLGEFGETVILDWGLAHVEGEDAKKASAILSTKAMRPRSSQAGKKGKPSESSESASSSGRLTLAGSIVGTPSYMPLEQAMGKLEQVDELSDVYSLGAILYEILSGTRAYPGEDAYEILDAVMAGPPPILSVAAPDVPPELVAVVEKAMAREKSLRFLSARNLAMELEAWRDGRAVASYKYSTGEQVRRIVKRHRAVVTTVSAALLVLLIVGSLALYSINAEKNEAEQARERAETVSTELVAEKQAREKLQAEAADRWGKIRAEKKSEYDRGIGAVAAAMPLDKRQAEAEALLVRWEKAGRPEPKQEMRREQEAAMLRLNETVQELERLLALAIEPIEDKPPQLFALDNAQGDAMLVGIQRDQINAAKLVSVRLCIATGDFALARYLLSWAAQSGLEGAKVTEEMEAIDAAQGAQLSKRRARIAFALEDAKAGLGRLDRQKEAPRLDDYVFELAGYRDPQTVEMLGAALRELAAKAGWVEGGSGGSLPSPDTSKSDGGPPPLQHVATSITWSQQERDVIAMCCRVLGRLDLGEEAVRALTPFSEVVADHELAVECGMAMGSTLHAEAWKPLLDMHDRLGDGSGIGGAGTQRALAASFRRLPLITDRLGPNPDIEQLRHHSRMLNMKGDLKGAADLTTRAIGLCKDDPKTLATLYSNRATFLYESDPEQALKDATLAIDLDPDLTRAYNTKGIVLYGFGDFHGAIKAYTRSLELNGKPSANMLTNRANSRWALGEREGAMSDIADAIAADPQHATARGKRSEYREQLGDYEGAIEDSNRAIALEPHNKWGYLIRGRAKSGLGDFPGAIEDLSRSISLDPQSIDALCNRAVARWNSGDKTNAMADLEAAAAIDRSSIAVLDQRARVLEVMEKYAEALADWDAIIASKPKHLAHYYSKRGECHGKNKNFEQALKDCTTAIVMDPTNAKLLVSRSTIYREMGEFQKVIDDTSAALLLDGKHLDALLERSSAFKELRQYDKALDDYAKMLIIDPRSLAALNNRALIFIDEKRYDDAIADYTRAIEVAPRNSVPWYNRARAWSFKLEWAKAIPDYSRAIELGHNDAVPWFLRGVAYHEVKDFLNALKDFDKGIELDETEATYWDWRAKVYVKLENGAAALADITKAIELGEINADRFEARGDAHRLLEEYDEAIKDYDQALALDPKNEVVHISRAATYTDKGDHLKAIEAYSAAITEFGSKFPYHANRGLAYHKSKDFDKAIDDYTKAIGVSEDGETQVSAVLNWRGQAYQTKKEWDKAIDDFTKSIDLRKVGDEDLPDTLKRRAECKCEKKDYAGAIADYERIFVLDVKNYMAMANIAGLYVELGEFEKALPYADKAIAIDDSDTNGHFNRGRALTGMKKFPEAIESLTRSVERAKTAPRPYDERGLARALNGDREGALADWEVAAKLEPTAVWRLVRLYECYAEDGNHTKALVYADKAIEQDQNVAKHHNAKGRALAGLARPKDAIKSFDEAYRLDPKDLDSLAERVRAKNNSGDYAGAVKDADEIVRLGGDEKLVLYYRAYAKRRLRDFEGAIRDLDRDMELAAPGLKPQSFKEKIAILAETGRKSEALAIFDAMFAKDPKDGYAFLGRAELFTTLHQFADAVKDYDQLVLYYPKAAIAWHNRGFAKTFLNDFDGAVEDFTGALAVNPNYVDSRRQRLNILALVGKPKEALIDAQWCKEAKMNPFGENKVAELEKVIALEPWLAKDPTTPEESILKTRAILGFSHMVKGIDESKQAAALLQSVIAAWKDVPTTDERWKDVADLAETLGERFYRHQDYPAGFRWYSQAHEGRQWLVSKSHAAYGAACSAALEAKRLAALEAATRATPASPGTEPKKTAPADSPESSKYWIEKAIAMLNAAADTGWSDVSNAENDNDLANLRTDPRWKPIIEKMIANQTKSTDSKEE